MQHSSIQLNEPVEFINTQAISPLVSRVQIKVCYVSDKPNRNGTVITKEVARNQLAPSLRGSPIVGYYNEENGDFEGHNQIIEISKNGEWKLKETTKPYGFVDLSARLWFQKFLDDGREERTYLMTEGYLWTEQYPESKRILTKGNSQSMALDENSVVGSWSESQPSFFVINEAIIKNLCILGDDVEPCFEGASIREPTIQFSFDPNFKTKMFSMITELKELISKGGEQVELDKDIEMIDIQDQEEVIDDNQGVEAEAAGTVEGAHQEEVSEEQVEPTGEEPGNATDPVEEKAIEEEAHDENPAEEVNYSLDEIPEYVELMNNYNQLKTDYNNTLSRLNDLTAEVEGLRTYKLNHERVEKQEMINKFFMLSDEDKADVIANIDTYSLDDIEAKLSVICVRNKVSFSTEGTENEGVLSYNLQGDAQDNDSNVPDWVKAVRRTQENMNNN